MTSPADLPMTSLTASLAAGLTASSASGSHAHSRHNLAIIQTSMFDGYVCVQYMVTPVPVELQRTIELFQSDGGLAVDENRRVYDCALAYRRSGRGDRVVGALRIGAVERHVPANAHRLRVLFTPFSATPELPCSLCELDLRIRRGVVEPTALRCGRSPSTK
ncbi:hypothetical protein ACSMXN_02610 [Jatrophihabitans sp. DSM 45814]